MQIPLHLHSLQFVQSERYIKYIRVYRKKYVALLNGLLITNIITIQTFAVAINHISATSHQKGEI